MTGGVPSLLDGRRHIPNSRCDGFWAFRGQGIAEQHPCVGTHQTADVRNDHLKADPSVPTPGTGRLLRGHGPRIGGGRVRNAIHLPRYRKKDPPPVSTFPCCRRRMSEVFGRMPSRWCRTLTQGLAGREERAVSASLGRNAMEGPIRTVSDVSPWAPARRCGGLLGVSCHSGRG